MNLKQHLLALAGAAVMVSAVPALAQPDKGPDARPAAAAMKEMPREGKDPRPFAERKASLQERLVADIELKQKLKACVTAAADEGALNDCMSALKKDRPGHGHDRGPGHHKPGPSAGAGPDQGPGHPGNRDSSEPGQPPKPNSIR